MEQFGYINSTASSAQVNLNGSQTGYRSNTSNKVNNPTIVLKTGFGNNTEVSVAGNDENDLDFSEEFEMSLTDAVKKFQKNFGLPVTGNLHFVFKVSTVIN